MRKRSDTTKLGVGLAVVLILTAAALVRSNVARSAADIPPDQERPFDQEKALAGLRQAIAGKEERPSSEVFKNIQILKGIPAGRLLRVMEVGFARSLGVSCVHCHVAGEWEKDDKPTKQIARDMFGMTNTINSQLLKNIKNLKGPNSIVNCTTCHRGQTKPELNLPDRPKP